MLHAPQRTTVGTITPHHYRAVVKVRREGVLSGVDMLDAVVDLLQGRRCDFAAFKAVSPYRQHAIIVQGGESHPSRSQLYHCPLVQLFFLLCRFQFATRVLVTPHKHATISAQGSERRLSRLHLGDPVQVCFKVRINVATPSGIAPDVDVADASALASHAFEGLRGVVTGGYLEPDQESQPTSDRHAMSISSSGKGCRVPPVLPPGCHLRRWHWW